MKKLSVLLVLLFTFIQGFAQSPVYYFNVATDTAYESNANVIAGYVKTNTPPTKLDSVYVVLTSGSPRPTHMDTASIYTIYFSAGQDSAPFIIQIMKDTFPEYPEHVVYDLRSSASGSPVGTDSSLTFVLIDTTPPAIIGFVVDTASYYEDRDSFLNGVYYQSYNAFPVAISVNNPNPFYVRFETDNIDAGNPLYPDINAVYLVDFFFNPQVYYAPPGNSTFYQTLFIVDRNSTSDKYFYCTINNVDANVLTDSMELVTIKHVNYFDTASLSFDTNSITVVGDSFTSIGIPITIHNTNMKPLYFRIDTIQTNSLYPGINYTFNDQEYGYGNGITHDTFWVNFLNPHLTGDTISMVFALRNDSVNLSPDTLLSVLVVDTGSLMVSFVGAGFAYLKSDSVGYVRVYTSSFAKFPIAVEVSYLNGNAIRDTDFIFDDTTIIFPQYTYDTISLPVIMLQDHLHSGNTQLNLQLTNVNPQKVQYGISEYSYIIIDNEDSDLAQLGLSTADNSPGLKAYPNPIENDLQIQTPLQSYHIVITNDIGDDIYEADNRSGDQLINLGEIHAGAYILKIWSGDIVYYKEILKL